MTMVVAWPDSNSSERPAWQRLVRRLVISIRLAPRRLARRRFVNRVMAETRDPAVLAELGIRPGRPSHTERWVSAMLWHQH